jgi:hypothetical protein
MSSGSSQTETTLKMKSGDTRVSAEDLFLELSMAILQSGLPGSQILLSNSTLALRQWSNAPCELG